MGLARWMGDKKGEFKRENFQKEGRGKRREEGREKRGKEREEEKGPQICGLSTPDSTPDSSWFCGCEWGSMVWSDSEIGVEGSR